MARLQQYLNSKVPTQYTQHTCTHQPGTDIEYMVTTNRKKGRKGKLKTWLSARNIFRNSFKILVKNPI